MEPQAKERLTGGVILVVLLVLLVPELLTGPRPEPPMAPAQPDEAPMRSYTLDLGDPAHAGSAPVAASATPSTPPTPPTQPTPPTPSVQSAPSVAAAGDAATTAPAPPAAAHGGKSTAAHGGEPTAAHGGEPTHARAREPAATDHSGGHSAGHATATWTVQLGTFGSRENAVRLAGTVKSRGFSASISEVTRNGRPLFRVRVGSERDRAAAQKLLGRLRAAGQKGGEVVPR